MIESMTLGPLIVGLEGLELEEEEYELLRHPAVGGVVLFGRNFAADSDEQLACLVAEIRDSNCAALIATDHEGGRVQRFVGAGFTQLPAPASLAAAAELDPESALLQARDLGWLAAAELRAVGIDLSLAPVVDLAGVSSLLEGRCLGKDPQRVSALAEAVIDGMKEAGMAAVAKHFPGHGGVAADSHEELPVDPRTLDQFELRDLLPYRYLIEKQKLAGVMAAHLLIPEVDGAPVCYSEFWLRRYLREILGFTGAVVADDLDMEGAAAAGDLTDRAVTAVTSGCDFVLLCRSLDCRGEVADALLEIGMELDRSGAAGKLRGDPTLPALASAEGRERRERARRHCRELAD